MYFNKKNSFNKSWTHNLTTVVIYTTNHSPNGTLEYTVFSVFTSEDVCGGKKRYKVRKRPRTWWIHTHPSLHSTDQSNHRPGARPCHITPSLRLRLRRDKYPTLFWARSQSVNCGVAGIRPTCSAAPGPRCQISTETQVRISLHPFSLMPKWFGLWWADGCFCLRWDLFTEINEAIKVHVANLANKWLFLDTR